MRVPSKGGGEGRGGGGVRFIYKVCAHLRAFACKCVGLCERLCELFFVFVCLFVCYYFNVAVRQFPNRTRSHPWAVCALSLCNCVCAHAAAAAASRLADNVASFRYPRNGTEKCTKRTVIYQSAVPTVTHTHISPFPPPLSGNPVCCVSGCCSRQFVHHAANAGAKKGTEPIGACWN